MRLKIQLEYFLASIGLSAFLTLLAILAAAVPMPSQSPSPVPPQPWSANLNDVRHVASMIPGPRALRITMLKFAESRRTKNFSVQGAPSDPSVQARTVFQVVYRDGYVMIDSGMDEQVHKFFGRGVVEPYFPDAARQVERALLGAR